MSVDSSSWNIRNEENDQFYRIEMQCMFIYVAGISSSSDKAKFFVKSMREFRFTSI